MIELAGGLWTVGALPATALIGLAAQSRERTNADASGLAAAVDVISESPQVSTGTYPVSADAIRIETDRIASKRAGTVACEQVLAEMTPVRDGTLLWELLQGARPEHLFDTASGFEASVEAAQDRTAEWRTDGDEVRVRPVRWQGIEVTLVGT
jgi:hypothetical protein